MPAIDLPLPHAMRGVTLDVVITRGREARLRLWLGAHLIKLGARVIGCGVEIGAEPTEQDIIHYQPLGFGEQRFVIGRRIRS